ncbi:MAG: hypothetical protein KGJ79_01105 [Alphaproteobacteria bacterium]|nr:hypothetical protein [Alphaproteobacteria bacterium]MDE2109710.1 hypothetical protein [Alphaproteobacteria bacterium]MDE2494947.1 hypothetical protein [Alphaproteobacteria bacterium]
MAKEVHFEIFSRRGAKGGWKLAEVKADRDESVRIAQTLMAEEGATGVKVVKETYDNETGDYLSLKIFEDGHNKMKSTPAQEDVPHALPCFKPDDLYSYHARQTIRRLIPDFLARNKITLTELSHRADMLEKLEATGTLLQHAIQKVAVAQAASTTTPVQKIIKSLNELTTKAFHRVYRDQRKGYFPDVERGGFGALAVKLAGQPDGIYVLNGAIARYLYNTKSWNEKVVYLLALMEETPEDAAGSALLLSAIDTIIAEILTGSAALHELLGPQENLGAALMTLVQLFLGKEPEVKADRQQGLVSLTERFANDSLPEARTAIAQRIIAEFKSVKRLCPESLVDEFKTLRQIANRVVLGVGKYLSHEDLVAAFTLRSKRLINQVTLTEHLTDSVSPDDKLERLLFVEENIIGAENKRQLAAFVIPIITATNFEGHFQSSAIPLLTRLQRLGTLSARVRRSGFQENQRTDFLDLLDRVANDVEARGKLFESIDAKTADSVEKANIILRMFATETFTEPRLATRAREQVVGYLSRPGFLTGYVEYAARNGAEKIDAGAAMADLMQILAKIGITQETGLKSIAA